MALEASGCGRVCAELRKLDDVFDTQALGDVDKIALLLLGVCGRGYQQEELICAVESASEGFRPGKVALDQFNARKRDGPGARAIAHESADGQAPVKESFDEFEADIA